MFVGRRIMAELFLEKHSHDLHLYGNGLSQKVDNIYIYIYISQIIIDRTSSGSTHTRQRPAGVGGYKNIPYQWVVLHLELKPYMFAPKSGNGEAGKEGHRWCTRTQPTIPRPPRVHRTLIASQ